MNLSITANGKKFSYNIKKPKIISTEREKISMVSINGDVGFVLGNYLFPEVGDHVELSFVLGNEEIDLVHYSTNATFETNFIILVNVNMSNIYKGGKVFSAMGKITSFNKEKYFEKLETCM